MAGREQVLLPGVHAFLAAVASFLEVHSSLVGAALSDQCRSLPFAATSLTPMSTFRSSLLLAASLLFIGGTSAQNVRINLFSGYTFQDKFPIGGTYYNGGSPFNFSEGVIEESAHFGGSIEFDVRRNKAIELLYQNQPTTGYYKGSNNLIEANKLDVTVNYIMIGGLNYVPFSDRVKGYGGINLGCAFLTGDAEATKFAFGGKLGLAIDMSPTVGLKLGAQVMSPVQWAGGGAYFGTGGASAGVSTSSSIYQFGFTGGLVFTLPRGGSAPSARPSSSTPPPPPGGGGVPPPPPPPPPQR